MSTVESEYRSAVQLFQAGRIEEAETICRRLTATASRYAPAFHLLGLIAERNQKRDAAVRAFRKAVALDGQNPHYHLALAGAYEEQGLADETFAALRAGAEQNPSDVSLLIALASMCANRGRASEAIDLSRRVLALVPGNVMALSNLGVTLLETGDFAGAREIWDRLRHAKPDELNVINGAISWAGTEEFDRALEIIGQPIANAPMSPWRASVQADLKLAAALRQRYVGQSKMPEAFNEEGLADYAGCIRDSVPRAWDPGVFLVFFHVVQNGSNPAIDDRRADYEELLHFAAAAGRQRERDVKVVLLTDRESRFQDDSFADCVVRLPMRRAWIMYERMRAQRAFAASGCLVANTLFLDSDVLLARSFQPIFNESFDVGLTWRTTVPWMPINGGMIMARQNRADEVVRFYDRCLAAYEDMVPLDCVRERYAFDIRHFQGDQLAMAAVSKWQVPPVHPSTFNIDGTSVRFFACADVNETFESRLDSEVLKRKYALHFKGAQKVHMRQFAQHAGLKV